MRRFTFVDCGSVEAALSQLKGNAALKAGGIDLLDRMKQGIEAPETLVNLQGIASLRGIREERSGVVLGPLVTLAELAVHPLLRTRYAVLADAAACAAIPQIRNVATLAGNLLQRSSCWYYRSSCWYYRSSDFHCLKKGGDRCFALHGLNPYHAIFDNSVCPVVAPSTIAVALYALDARVELTSSRGKRVVAIDDLYVKPDADPRRETVLASDEILTAVRIPQPAAGARSAYQKYAEKESFDRAIADAGVLLEMEGDLCRRAVIVMGAASPTPRRAMEAEALLTGRRVTEQTARAAGKAAMRGATPLAMNGYKLQLFPVAIYRTILLAAGKAGHDPGAAG
jgi:xanthine dehydrogenase YagS FAD-binding subunit